MSLTLYFLRHGETAYSKTGEYCGELDIELTPAEIQQKYATGNVLVASHKATIRVILCDLLGIDLGRYRDRIEMLAGSVTIVKFDLHGPLLQELGNRFYMGEDLRSRPGN